MTLMFTAFEDNPLILRLYGTARAIHKDDAEWQPHQSPPFSLSSDHSQARDKSLILPLTSCKPPAEWLSHFTTMLAKGNN